MNKKIKIALIIVLVILAVSISYIVFQNKNKQAPYSVVYLTSGEIYIGKIETMWPKMEMSDVYLLQVIKDKEDATKSNFQLTPLKDALWSPKKLYINKDNVLFYGPIEETSRAAEAIKEAKK